MSAELLPRQLMDEQKNKPNRELLLISIRHPFDSDILIGAFENLALNLKPIFHTYDTLIGDDISGRLPTLVFASLLRQRRKQMDLPAPKIFFINAGSSLSFSNYRDANTKKLSQLINMYAYKPKKALIVTEYMESGDSIFHLLKALRPHGITPDVCTISTRDEMCNYSSAIPARIFAGQIQSKIGVRFFDHSEVTGLISSRSSPISQPSGNKSWLREEMLIARQDMRLIADYLWKIIE